MSTKPNDNAFPFGYGGTSVKSGLTKREYFAARAMQAILSNTEWCHVMKEKAKKDNTTADFVLAKFSWKLADELIAQSNKEE